MQFIFFQIFFWSIYIIIVISPCSSRYYYLPNNANAVRYNKDYLPWYRSLTFGFSATIISIILIMGLYCDAMSIGDEGTRFLTWNKDINGQQTNAGDQIFSYSLTSSFSPDYNVTNHQWNKMSDVYDINVDINRIFNLTGVDQFLTKYHCRLGERIPVAFGSIPWGSPSHTVNINC